MGLRYRLKKIAKKYPFTVKNIKGVLKLIYDPKLSKSYYPELPRKSKLTILRENFSWLAKHNEVNKFYYVYGMDLKLSQREKEVIPNKEFHRLIDKKNLWPSKTDNYVCILRDKFVFAQFVASLGIPTANNLALLTSNQVTWLSDMQSADITSLVEGREININGFCKKLDGIVGKGAFALQIKNKKLYIKEKEITLSKLKEKMDGVYLLQERIIQHPNLASLNPDSVNTIRINTFNDKGKVELFSAALRMGTKNSSVDNWAAGGILVGIDTESGKLRKDGFFKPGFGGKVEKHPNTNITFDGFQIPYFNESIRLACNLHSYIYGIHSVGWDIAITETGPVIIEGNDNWDGVIPMVLERNFKSRFMKHFVN